MENAISVANYFVKKSLETGIVVTPMKLVKLVYISHGWYLGLTGQPLIAEGVEAWKYGPVVSSVYSYFKFYKDGAVTQPAYRFVDGYTEYYTLNNSQLIPFLDRIWDLYKSYTGLELSAMTHRENTPWHSTWHNGGGKDRFNVVIPNNLIESHYKARVSENVA